MTTEEVLSRLAGPNGRVTGGNGNWKVQCPAHKDPGPSLHVTQTATGTLLKCHAGCKTEDILRAAALRFSDLFTGTAPRSAAKPYLVESYEYRNSIGELQYVVDRMSDKNFPARRPDGRGGWIWNINGIPRLLYMLEQLLESDGLVFITEGEKDVNSLVRLGLTATCNSGGAGKFLPGFADHLAGRSVVILPDNDEKGIPHGHQVAGFLKGKAASIKMLTFDGYKDVSDWLAACGTREKLLDLVAECLEWVAPLVVTPVPTEPHHHLRLIRLSDVQPKEVNWLWKNIAAFGKLTLFVGDPGQSKSLLTIDVIARATRGGLWPDGSTVEKKCTVLVLNCEDDLEDTIAPRLLAANADLARVQYVEASCIIDAKSGIATDMQFSLQRDVDILERAILAADGPVLVVIDPMGNHMQGKDTHKDSEVREALMPLAEMLQRTGAAAIGVCHLNKSSASSAMYRVSGSVGFVGVARSVWTVTRDPNDRHSPRRLFLPLKANLAPDVSGLAYEIKTAINGHAFLSWEDSPVSTTVDEALAPADVATRSNPDREAAEEWLRDFLSEGPKLSAEVFEAAEANGHTKATMKRARRALGVVTDKSGFQGQWAMRLPSKEVDLSSPQNW